MRPCCFTGPVPPEGTVRGCRQSIAGVDCYVADRAAVLSAVGEGSAAPTPCVVMAPDMFGLSKHCMLLADEMNVQWLRHHFTPFDFRSLALSLSLLPLASDSAATTSPGLCRTLRGSRMRALRS